MVLLCLVRQNIIPATNISRHTDSRRFAHGPLGTGGMADGRFYFATDPWVPDQPAHSKLPWCLMPRCMDDVEAIDDERWALSGCVYG